MADEREVSIVIKAKNLTAEEFQKAREQLSGMKAKTDEAAKSGETFGQKLLGAKSAGALFSDQVKSIAAGFTIASLLDKAVGAAVSWTAGLYANASALVKQHEKTGVSIEMLQRWQKVAKQTDVDQAALTNSAYKFGLTMQEGSQTTKDALSRIGLSYDDLRKKSPDDQLDLTIKALAGVADVGERNYIGNQLLGKSYAELAPAVSEYEKIVNSVTVASDGQVRALKEQQEAIERQTQSWNDWWTQVFGNWALAREASAKLTSQQQATWQAIVKSGGDGQAYLLKLANERIAKEKEVTKAAQAAAGTQQKISANFVEDLRKSQQEVSGLSVAQRGQIAAAIAMGSSESDVAQKLGISQTAVKLYKDQVADSKKKTEDTAKATADYAKKIKGVNDELTGRNLQQKVRELSEAIKENGGLAGYSAYQLAKLGEDAAKMREQGAALTPELTVLANAHSVLATTVAHTSDGWVEGAKSVKKYTDRMEEMQARVALPIAPIPFDKIFDPRVSQQVMAQAEQAAQAAKTGFDTGIKGAFERGLTYALEAAAQSSTIKGALGILGSSVADQVGGYFATMDGAGPLTRGFGQALQLASRQPSLVKAISAFAGTMGSAIGGQIGFAIGGPMGKAVGSALGSLVGPVINKFFGSAGRDAVKEFAATFGGADGGWDNLHKQLGALGAQGEQLWIKLTQGVGKNNPQQAKAVIDEITQALDAQARSSEAAAAAFTNAQDKIGAALAGVTAKVGGQATSYIDLRQKVTDAQKAYDDLVAAGAGQDEIKVAADNLALAQAGVFGATRTTQEEFDRLSRVALNTFNTLVASGVSPVEAMQRIGTSVDDLMANVDAFGLSGGAAYDQLARWRTLTTENAPLLTQVGSLNDLMTMTTTLGGMNADVFKDMQAQGVDAYNQLLRAGYTEAEARAVIKPLLEREIQLSRDKGYAIDEATQKIIDQARANRELTDEGMSTNRILMDGMTAFIEAVGGKVPEAWVKAAGAAKSSSEEAAAAIRDKFAKHAVESVNDVKGAIGGIFDEFSGGFEIPVTFDVDKTGLDGVGGWNGGGTGGGETASLNAYASGGIAEGRQVALIAERGRREIAGDQSFMATALMGAIDRLGGLAAISPRAGVVASSQNINAILEPILEELQLLRAQKAGDLVAHIDNTIDPDKFDRRVVRVSREAHAQGKIPVRADAVKTRVAG